MIAYIGLLVIVIVFFSGNIYVKKVVGYFLKMASCIKKHSMGETTTFIMGGR